MNLFRTLRGRYILSTHPDIGSMLEGGPMKFYLAHPFEIRREVRSWELQIEGNTRHDLINPFYDLNREDVAVLDDPTTSRESRSAATRDFVSLVHKDLYAMLGCAAVLAVIPDDIRTIGTICECWEAARSGIPIYFICGPKTAIHPWVKYMVYKTGGFMFRSWEGFRNVIS
jgi:hypothetical protein